MLTRDIKVVGNRLKNGIVWNRNGINRLSDRNSRPGGCQGGVATENFPSNELAHEGKSQTDIQRESEIERESPK